MADRISISSHGIEIFHHAGSWTSSWPWEDLQSIAISTVCYPPDFERRILMDISAVNGEFEHVHDDVAGFAEALAMIATRGGLAPPDPAALSEEWTALWGRS